MLGPLTYRDIGLALMAGCVLLIVILQPRRQEPWAPWAGAAAIALAFFCLPTQIHERYLYPALVFLAVAAWADRRLLSVLGLLSTTFLMNLALVWPATPELDALAHSVGDGPRSAIAGLNLIAMFALVGWLAISKPQPLRRPSLPVC